ncbi:Cht6 family protein [Megaselia abdita]
MFPLPRGVIWLTLSLCLFSQPTTTHTSEGGRVVCYYTNWSVYRPGTAKFSPQNINPYLCTHLIYAFGGFTKDNTLKPFDKYQDIEQGGYAKFTGLKTYNKNLKTLLAIGGWNEASSRFSPLVANAERRAEFVRNILKFLRQNHFDGIDLDWEYPAFREGGKSRDRENYAKFVQELRAEFEKETSKTGRPRLLITMAVPAGVEYIEKGYDIPKLNKYLDWFNILSYDYHSAYEPSVNHHSPLYSLEEESEYNFDSDLNIDHTVKHYIKLGAQRDKLVLGMPTYGRSFTLFNEDSTDIGAPSDGPGEQGDATREKGYLAYYEICQNLKEDSDWTVVQPNPKAMGPYAFKLNQWVGYDDEAIARKKAEYVVEQGLGGIMFWSLDNDDFRGSCTGKPYPIIEAAKEALLESTGFGENEVIDKKLKQPARARSRNKSSSDRNKISNEVKSVRRQNANKRTTTTESSSLFIGGKSTTPPPPTTPDPGSDFKCKDEGFFQHPRDCKKYFWCLDSPNLGLVAHQFTCPSGLYFNPAADSCDFSRNVLCKKSQQATSTSTTTTAKPTTTTSSSRITAATSKNTYFRPSTTTTTTEEPYELEYEDEEETHVKGSEEDPMVIKELIDLIKKVGGIEELEKQLLQNEDGTMVLKNRNERDEKTTANPISKSLYDRVLSRSKSLNALQTRFKSNSFLRASHSPKTQEDYDENGEVLVESKPQDKYSSVIRNSRPGPQNEGLDQLAESEGFLREKPKYVTISRSHQKDEVVDESDNEKEETAEVVTKSSRFDNEKTVTHAYTNIRRSRPSTEKNVEEDYAENVEEEEEERTFDKRPYQSINRSRSNLDVTEAPFEASTAGRRYKVFSRNRVQRPQPDDEEFDDTSNVTSKFTRTRTLGSTINTTTNPTPIQNRELKISTTRRPKLSVRRRYPATTDSSNDQPITDSTTSKSSTARYNRRTRPSSSIVSSSLSSSTTTSLPTIENNKKQTTALRRKFRVNANRRSSTTLQTTTPSTIPAITTHRQDIAHRPLNQIYKRKLIFAIPRSDSSVTHHIDTPGGDEDTDQIAKSSIQDTKFVNNRLNNIVIDTNSQEENLVNVVKALSKAPLPLTVTPKNESLEKEPVIQDETTQRISLPLLTTKKSMLFEKIYQTTPISLSNPTTIPTPPRINFEIHRPQKMLPFTKFTERQFHDQITHRPIIDYDYYDDEDVRVIGRNNAQVKVILHGAGIIECLDQGNFPHPLSCKKFISCAKLESGGVVGWEYTCPKGLSYDPVGGICNWAAGLGCKE